MQIETVLRAFGGSARWSQLKGSVSRRSLKRAVAAGAVCRDHGTYSLPKTDYAVRMARRLRGYRSHRSAAEHWGFAMPPVADGQRDQHDIAIGAKSQRRNVPEDIRLRYLDLDDGDLIDGVLTPTATVAYCLRDLPLRDALSIGDSALRSGLVTFDELRRRVDALRGKGVAEARRRVDLLDARSANAFESSCRAILLAAGITGFAPQVGIRHRRQWIGRVDLAHRGLRIVIECEGFEHHGTLAGMTNDCVRHTSLVAAGWRPLRFTWFLVMFRPGWVLEKVRDTIAEASGTQIAVSSTIGGAAQRGQRANVA